MCIVSLFICYKNGYIYLLTLSEASEEAIRDFDIPELYPFTVSELSASLLVALLVHYANFVLFVVGVLLTARRRTEKGEEEFSKGCPK